MKYTTEQITKMVYSFREDMLSRGINVGRVCNVKFTKSTHNFGTCLRVMKGVYEITITDLGLHGDVISTIVHELIHTVEGCYDHGSKFQSIAKKLSKVYNIDLGTRASKKEMDMTREYRISKAKYVIKCTNPSCPCIVLRDRAVDVVKHTERYSCGTCGSKLIRVR